MSSAVIKVTGLIWTVDIEITRTHVQDESNGLGQSRVLADVVDVL